MSKKPPMAQVTFGNQPLTQPHHPRFHFSPTQAPRLLQARPASASQLALSLLY